jgi:hypothetical protein
VNRLEGGQAFSIVHVLHRVQLHVDLNEAFPKESGAVVYGIERVPEFVACDVDKLFLKFPAPVSLGCVRAFNLHNLTLQLAETRHVSPNADPAEQVPSCTGREFGLEIVYNLLKK